MAMLRNLGCWVLSSALSSAVMPPLSSYAQDPVTTAKQTTGSSMQGLAPIDLSLEKAIGIIARVNDRLNTRSFLIAFRLESEAAKEFDAAMRLVEASGLFDQIYSGAATIDGYRLRMLLSRVRKEPEGKLTEHLDALTKKVLSREIDTPESISRFLGLSGLFWQRSDVSLSTRERFILSSLKVSALPDVVKSGGREGDLEAVRRFTTSFTRYPKFGKLLHALTTEEQQNLLTFNPNLHRIYTNQQLSALLTGMKVKAEALVSADDIRSELMKDMAAKSLRSLHSSRRAAFQSELK
jgi:hypothetical protein